MNTAREKAGRFNRDSIRSFFRRDSTSSSNREFLPAYPPVEEDSVPANGEKTLMRQYMTTSYAKSNKQLGLPTPQLPDNTSVGASTMGAKEKLLLLSMTISTRGKGAPRRNPAYQSEFGEDPPRNKGCTVLLVCLAFVVGVMATIGVLIYLDEIDIDIGRSSDSATNITVAPSTLLSPTTAPTPSPISSPTSSPTQSDAEDAVSLEEMNEICAGAFSPEDGELIDRDNAFCITSTSFVQCVAGEVANVDEPVISCPSDDTGATTECLCGLLQLVEDSRPCENDDSNGSENCDLVSELDRVR